MMTLRPMTIVEALRTVSATTDEQIAALEAAGMMFADARALSRFEAELLLNRHPRGSNAAKLCTAFERKLVMQLLTLRGIMLIDSSGLTQAESDAFITAIMPARTSAPKKFRKRKAVQFMYNRIYRW